MEGDKEPKSQEAPSSSSKNKNNQKRKDKVDNGKVDEKLKMEIKTESEKQFVVNETSIDNLPPEMLMEIVENLDLKNLSACRLVNKKWNELVIEVLKLREDVEIGISRYQKSKKPSAKGKNGKERSLSCFMDCFKKSKNFPLSRFRCQVDNSMLENKDWMKFISDFGKNIQCLNLKVAHISEDRGLEKMSTNLNNVLLKQLPNLQEFGLDLSNCKTPNSALIQLFPNPKTKTASAAVQLPQLKVIYLNQCTISKYTGIVVDLLLAAVNLKHLWAGVYNSIENLHLLQALGKLHCVQDMEIRLSRKSFSGQFYQIQDKSQAPLVFQLKKLNLCLLNVYKDQSIRSTVASFLSNIFETSKDTLRKLDMHALGFLEELKLPKFSNLERLHIFGEKEVWETTIPPRMKLQNTFPVIRSLVLDTPWMVAFRHEDSTSSMPMVETLKVVNFGMDSTVIAQISSMFPNLKHLDISDSTFGAKLPNFPEVGTTIWTHLKKLQSLNLGVEVGTLNNRFPAVDSCITGFSKEDCLRLYDGHMANKLLSERNFKARVSQSALEAERKNPSILDLKDLKTLTIHLVKIHIAEIPSEHLAVKTLTIVSEEGAFKLMENLNYKINRAAIQMNLAA